MPDMQVNRPEHKQRMAFFSSCMFRQYMMTHNQVKNCYTYHINQTTVNDSKKHYTSTYSLFFFSLPFKSAAIYSLSASATIFREKNEAAIYKHIKS